VIGQAIGHYQITAKLGEGGMGEVYRATDTKLGREVALKILPAAFASDSGRMARFEREAKLLASLNHPHIAQIYGVEERALVMELVEGESPKGPLPFEDAWKIASQMASALDYAHEKGIVHRDLKPANVKVTPDGIVKLLDFGLAKAFTQQKESSGNAEQSPTLTIGATEVGVILGTAAYMAPEQAKGKSVDKRADIWAFGVVLYELLTGERLFKGEDVADTLAQVLTKEPQLDRAPAEARKLLRRCLEKDPKRRLRDIGEARFLLDDGRRAAPAPSRVNPSLAAVVVVLLGALGILAYIHFREKPATAPVVRFSVPGPEKGAWGTWLALSPDGRYLGFPATDANGVVRVWLRSLDSVELRPLPGTDGAGPTILFWSPDSRSAVFSSGGKIKRVEISGGPPQSLCDAPNATLGGSWNTDGVILFGSNGGPILRVPSTGGTPTPVTRPERERGETFHSDPIFLADGRHFLYFRHSGKPENQGVYVGSLDVRAEQQSLKRIEAVDFSPGYAPPRDGGDVGHLLFLRDTFLVARPFNERSLSIAGDAVTIAEHVGTSISRAFFSVSGNGILAYRGGTGGTSQLTWYDREGHTLGRAGDADDYLELALSPDGSRVAYTKPFQGAGRQIWTLDLARGIPTRLTFEPRSAHSPVWSPDGRRLAYSTLTGDGLYVQDVDTSGRADLLLSTVERNEANSWSRDGRFLVFTQLSDHPHLFGLPDPLGGGGRKPVVVATSEFAVMNGQVSPDSRWIAYASDESGKYEIYVRPFPPGDGRTKMQVSSTGGQQPRWRADGNELFYLAPDRTIMSLNVQAQPTFQTTTPRVLFPAPPTYTPSNSLWQWDVTRDGKRFLAIASVTSTTAQATVVLNWDAALKK